MNWLLISCVCSFVAACILGLLLYLNWRAERRHLLKRLEPYDEPFGDCPWPIAEPESRANFHNVQRFTR